MIEAEALVEGNDAYKVTDWETASGGKLIQNNLVSTDETNYGAGYKDEISFTLNVEEAGLYDVEAAFSNAGSKLPEYVTWINVYVDDVKIDSNWYGAGKTVSTYENSPNQQYAPITVRSVENVELSAEPHTVKIEIENAGSYISKVPTFDIDYIKFTANDYVAPVEVSDDITLIEVENYTASKGEAEYCSGGAYALAENDGTGAAKTIKVRLDVKETGVYDIEAALAKCNAAEYWSMTKVYLDSTDTDPIISNWKYDTYSPAVSTYEESPDSTYPITVYVKEGVELTAGEHTLIITGTKPSLQEAPNMHFDYIKLTPEGYGVDTCTMSGLTANVKAYYDEAVSGDAIIALYDIEGKLVGIDTILADAQTEISKDVVCKKTPVECKVFVWDSLTTLNPVTDSKIIEIR